MTAYDEALERRIEHAKESMTHSASPHVQRYWEAEMRRLIKQRSPEQVERMERKVLGG